MKKNRILILSFAFITMAFAGYKPNHIPKQAYLDITDTIPDICLVLPPKEIAALQPFTSPLSGSFPDPNNFENYSGCHYQFYTPDDKPQLAVRFIKWESKKDAGNEFSQQVRSHFDHTGVAPERIPAVADSAYFSINIEEVNLCDECGLVAAQGPYTIYISFKGKITKITRARAKEVALQILKMMYDRIPGLAPSRIRDRQ